MAIVFLHILKLWIWLIPVKPVVLLCLLPLIPGATVFLWWLLDKDNTPALARLLQHSLSVTAGPDEILVRHMQDKKNRKGQQRGDRGS